MNLRPIMKKPDRIPDDIGEMRGYHGFGDWCPTVKVGGNQIEAKVEWLSGLERKATLREALDLYPANMHLSHADGGGAWAVEHGLDESIGSYLATHCNADRVIKVTLDLKNLGLRSIDEVEGLATIPRIDDLIISGNHLGDRDVVALSHMTFSDTLRFLAIDNNLITYFPTKDFPILEILWLGGNKVTSIGLIQPSSTLEMLDISHSEIMTITSADIAKFPDLIRLDIESNYISVIPDFTSLENQWREKRKNWQDRPLSLIAERRSSSSDMIFKLNMRKNPIKALHPNTLRFFKAGIQDGSLKIFCDDSVKILIDNA